MTKSHLDYKLINLVLIVLLIYLIYQTRSFWLGVVSILKEILLPFFIAFIIAYAIYPLISSLIDACIRKGMQSTIKHKFRVPQESQSKSHLLFQELCRHGCWNADGIDAKTLNSIPRHSQQSDGPMADIRICEDQVLARTQFLLCESCDRMYKPFPEISDGTSTKVYDCRMWIGVG